MSDPEGARPRETRIAAIQALLDDYDALLGDGVTEATQPAVRREAVAALADLQADSARCAALEQERDEARKIVAAVNNSVIGSEGYFTEPSCVDAIEQSKASSNAAYSRARDAEAQSAALRHGLEQLLEAAERYRIHSTLQLEEDVPTEQRLIVAREAARALLAAQREPEPTTKASEVLGDMDSVGPLTIAPGKPKIGESMGLSENLIVAPPTSARHEQEPSQNRALARLDELAADPRLQQPGWADRGSQPLDARAIAAVRRFLAYEWAVVPCQDGGLQVERHHSGCDLEIVFAADGTVDDVFAQRAPSPSEPEPPE